MDGLPRISGGNCDCPDGRISPVFRGSTARMGTPDFLGLLDWRSNLYPAFEKTQKSKLGRTTLEASAPYFNALPARSAFQFLYRFGYFAQCGENRPEGFVVVSR